MEPVTHAAVPMLDILRVVGGHAAAVAGDIVRADRITFCLEHILSPCDPMSAAHAGGVDREPGTPSDTGVMLHRGGVGDGTFQLGQGLAELLRVAVNDQAGGPPGPGRDVLLEGRPYSVKKPSGRLSKSPPWA